MEELSKIEKDILSDSKTAADSAFIEFIKQIVCNYYKQDITLLEAKTRKREIIKCRQISMYLIAKNSKISLDKIGNKFNKGHCTVIHSKKLIASYLEWDRELKMEIEELQNVVKLKNKFITGNLNLDRDLYFIDLNEFSSVRFPNGKSIILTGFTDEEVKKFDFTREIAQATDGRKHTKTGMYVLEKK